MATKGKKLAKSKEVFDFRTIKTFEDACKKLGIDPAKLPGENIPKEFSKPTVSAYKLMVIYKAINNGWKPDWSDHNQCKYYPWHGVLSSGFGFDVSDYYYAYTVASVGSRLCTDTSEKALYIANQFEAEYKEFFLYSE
jgi:hypothetical protein